MKDLILYLKQNYRFESDRLTGLLDELTTEMSENNDALYLIASIMCKKNKGEDLEFDCLALLNYLKKINLFKM